jgi:NodT family efflux transporter outer membrane factor (OMF) lipoprotein
MNKNSKKALAALTAALLLAGCASTGNIAPPAQLRDAASLNLQLTSAQVAAVPIAPQWWRGFGDAQLDRLVAQALAGNPNLRIAQARLTRAQAVSAAAAAALAPQVNGALDITTQRYTKNGIIPPPLAGTVQTTGTAQLAGSWEIDFFGKNRAALDAALGAARAAQADAEAARILLASNVVRSYLQVARANGQLAVAQRQLAQREQALGLVRDRVSAGLDTRLELRQSEGGLPEARQLIEALQEQAEIAGNALAALVGQPNARVLTTAPQMASIKPLAARSFIRTSTWSPSPGSPASAWAT